MSCGGGHLQCTVKMSLYFQASILSQEVSPDTLKTDHLLMVSITMCTLKLAYYLKMFHLILWRLTIYSWSQLLFEVWVLSQEVSPYTLKTDHFLMMLEYYLMQSHLILRRLTIYSWSQLLFEVWVLSQEVSPYISQIYHFLMQSHLMLWVSDCCLAIFQLYHGENKLTFNEMMIRFTLY
jgi:hypothetical protein